MAVIPITNPIGGPSGGVQRANLTITSAQLLALNTTRQTIVGAPGSGRVLVPLYAIASHSGGTAYAGIASGEDIQINYGSSGTSAAISFETTGFLDQTTAQLRTSFPSGGLSNHTPAANAALTVRITSGAITTGDFDLTISLFYAEQALP